MKEYVIETVYEYFLIKSTSMYRAVIEGRYICRKYNLKYLRVMTRKSFDDIKFPKARTKTISVDEIVSLNGELYILKIKNDIPELIKYKNEEKLKIYEY